MLGCSCYRRNRPRTVLPRGAVRGVGAWVHPSNAIPQPRQPLARPPSDLEVGMAGATRQARQTSYSLQPPQRLLHSNMPTSQ